MVLGWGFRISLRDFRLTSKYLSFFSVYTNISFLILISY